MSETPDAQEPREARLKPEFMAERSGRAFALYAGLLDLSHQLGLKGITTTLVQAPTELNGHLAVVYAQVELPSGSFTGLGDASPQSVSAMMRPHLIRMAETRAKARALRDAVNVGVAALEELGGEDGDAAPEEVRGAAAAPRPTVDPNSPPTPEQKRALGSLAKAAGVDVRLEELTYGQAADQIVRLQKSLDSRRLSTPPPPERRS